MNWDHSLTFFPFWESSSSAPLLPSSPPPSLPPPQKSGSLCQRDRERGGRATSRPTEFDFPTERERPLPPPLTLSLCSQSHYFVLSAIMCLCVGTVHMGDERRATTTAERLQRHKCSCQFSSDLVEFGVCVFSTVDYTQSLDEAQERWREKLSQSTLLLLLKIKVWIAASLASKCRLLFWNL